MKITLVGYDVAPSRAFALLVSSTGEIEFNCYLAAQRLMASNEMYISIAESDAVLIGLSSEKTAKMEIEAADDALHLQRPFGFYADTFGAWNREWFSPYRNVASFVFVINEVEKNAAQEVFPNAVITATGNPLWADYFKPANRDAVRQWLDVEENDCVILSPGSKDPVINVGLWTSVIETVHKIDVPRVNRRILLFSQHPGDKTLKEVYNTLLRYSRKWGQMVDWTSEPADRYIPGVDVVIDQGSSVGIHAIARRIPVIDHFSSLAREWLYDSGGTFRTAREEARSACSSSHPNELRNILTELLSSASSSYRRHLRNAQERFLPECLPGVAEGKMIQALVEAVKANT